MGLLTAAAGVQRHMVAAVVAAHHMAAEVVVAVAPIVKISLFRKGPPRFVEAGLFSFFAPLARPKARHNSLCAGVLNK